jgi:hypothetical protein
MAASAASAGMAPLPLTLSSSASQQPASRYELNGSLSSLLLKFPRITDADFQKYAELLDHAECPLRGHADTLMMIKAPLFVIQKQLGVLERTFEGNLEDESWTRLLSEYLTSAVIYHPDPSVLSFLQGKGAKLPADLGESLQKIELSPKEVKAVTQAHLLAKPLEDIRATLQRKLEKRLITQEQVEKEFQENAAHLAASQQDNPMAQYLPPTYDIEALALIQTLPVLPELPPEEEDTPRPVARLMKVKASPPPTLQTYTQSD